MTVSSSAAYLTTKGEFPAELNQQSAHFRRATSIGSSGWAFGRRLLYCRGLARLLRCPVCTRNKLLLRSSKFGSALATCLLVSHGTGSSAGRSCGLTASD